MATLYWNSMKLTQSDNIVTNRLDGGIVNDPQKKIKMQKNGTTLYQPANLLFDYSNREIALTKNIKLVDLPSSTSGKSTTLLFYTKIFTIGKSNCTGDLI